MYLGDKSKRVVFRIGNKDLDYLNWLSLQYECSMSEVLRKIIRHYRVSSEVLKDGNTAAGKFD